MWKIELNFNNIMITIEIKRHVQGQLSEKRGVHEHWCRYNNFIKFETTKNDIPTDDNGDLILGHSRSETLIININDIKMILVSGRTTVLPTIDIHTSLWRIEVTLRHTDLRYVEENLNCLLDDLSIKMN